MRTLFIFSLLALTSLTGCLQKHRAQVDIREGLRQDRYGNHYDMNGNQIPRYSNQYRAPMPPSQDAKYIHDDYQTYGIEAPVAPIGASDLPPITNDPINTPAPTPSTVASVTTSETTVDPMIAQRLAEEQKFAQVTPNNPKPTTSPFATKSAPPTPKVPSAALDQQLLPKGFVEPTPPAPPAAVTAPIQEPAPLQAAEDKSAQQKEQQQIAAMQKMSAAPSFTLPVRGEIIKNFAQTGKQGIAIAGRNGEPVRASAQGKVLHVGNVDEFGTVVIIQHANGLLTTYGHLGDTVVAKGQDLNQGSLIGFVGKTGNVSAPQLHFSIREGTKAVDPSAWIR
ncbi:MAG: M23 family metallopeptidase [Alphaproteobacteria bacterium]|nr:MAG: M23 family metallopeptidase [Alphaproteobacteria bacterium]